MWWHHMEALEAFNVLVNYWWRQSPAWMDTPMNALMHAIMTVRDLPPAQRETWQEVFRHYVFEADETTAGHIRSEEHTSELQSLMRISYAVFCLKKKKNNITAKTQL